MAEVEIRLLGPFEVRLAGEQVTVSGDRQRSLLAALALSAGRSVSVDALAGAVWGDELPERVRGSLQTYVMRLRQLLGDTVIVTTRGGYKLDVDPDRIDAVHFPRLVDAARNTHDTAQQQQLLAEAVGLWQGDALDGVPSAVLQDEQAPLLVEQYLTAVERQVDLDLATGTGGDWVAELRDLVSRHPLREPLWERLIHALANAGRNAEALAAYADCRAHLVDELGVEPGPGLRQLHLELLDADKPDTATAAHRPAPRNELPRDVGYFTGRDDELHELLDVARIDTGTTVVISAIDGMAGIGKTTLAVRAARQLADGYPDGQLWLDLYGHTPGQHPLSPAAGLDRLLRSIGVSGDQVPDGVDERATMWRTQMAGRRALIVLDNALHSEQVQPLLPGAPGCLVLVTSRQRLLDLDCAQVLSLDVLPEGDAIDLFARAVGDGRVAAEPHATVEVVTLCGLLPLAIRIAAARLRHRPHWTVEALAGKLRDRQGRLAQLHAENRDLGAVFDLSYQHLTDELQRLFRLLGLHPGADIDSYAAAALADLSPQVAEAQLQRLVDAHLLREHTPGRYQLHDLLRVFATQLVTDRGDDGRARLFDYYVRTAGASMDVLLPAERHHRPTLEPLALPTPELPDDDSATAWIDAERSNLLSVAAYAAEHGWHRHTVHLSSILSRYLSRRSLNDDTLVLHTAALESARRVGGGSDEVRVLCSLADLNLRCGDSQNARDHSNRALGIARDIGDRVGECRALKALGMLQGGPSLNADYLQQALALARELGDRFIESRASLNLGIELWRLGRRAEAFAHNEHALVVSRESGDSGAEHTALNNLGNMYALQGDHLQAVDHLEQALSLARRICDRKGQGEILHSLADTYAGSGDQARAARYLQDGLANALDTGNRELEVEILISMGRLAGESGDLPMAIDRHRQAVAVAAELVSVHLRARAHDALGETQHHQGDLESTAEEWRIALGLFEELGVPDADEVRAKLNELSTNSSLPAR